MATSRPTVLDVVVQRATDAPSTTAFVVGDDRLTYGGLADDARALARRLARLGVACGDRCAISLASPLDAVRLCYACHVLGAVPVMVDPAQWVHVRERRMAAVSATVAVTDVARPGTKAPGDAREISFADLGRLAPASLPAYRALATDAAYLQFTSGSTGEPRAVVVSHAALTAALDAMRERYDLGAHDRVAGRAPLHHSTGLVRYLFGTPWFGAVAHLLPPSASHVGSWLDAIARARATITNTAEFAYRVATELRMDTLPSLNSLRIATTGGESVRAATVTAFERRFGLSRIVQPAYGLSEATLIVSSAGPGDALVVDDSDTVSCGRAMPGLDIRVVDANGAEQPAGVEGEIQVRGAQLFDGYFGDVQATADVLRDGWLSTGDMGHVDHAGRLFPRSRARALIKRAGVAIAPRDIEQPLESLPSVAGVAAIGVLLPSGFTEEIVIVVETTAETTDDLVELVRRVDRSVFEAVATRPGRILLVSPATIPRTSLGKVRQLALREDVLSGALEARALHVS